MAENNDREETVAIEEELDRLVIRYLRHRKDSSALSHLQLGDAAVDQYSQEEQVYIENHKTMYHLLYKYVHSEMCPEWYIECFEFLRQFIENSMDEIRIELNAILFPVFMNIAIEMRLRGHTEWTARFIERYMSLFTNSESQSSDTHKLITAAQEPMDPKKFLEIDLVARYRTYKCRIELTSFSHRILMAWLRDAHLDVLSTIVNERLVFKLVGDNSRGSDTEDEKMMDVRQQIPVGNKEDTQRINRISKVSFGLNRDFDETERSALTKRKPKGGEPSAPTQRIDVSDLTVPHPKMNREQKKQLFHAIRKRVYAGPDRLPSICSYKFVNAFDNVCSGLVSQDGRWIIGGCRDSKISVFDCEQAREHAQEIEEDGKQREEQKTPPVPNGPQPMDIDQKNDGSTVTSANMNESKIVTKLIGHSGSVFGMSMSRDEDYLLTSSEDSTIRLWSLHLKQTVSVYKRHGFPVWDVDFSPLGFYFASASYDGTAALWSTDKLYPLRLFAGHIADVNVVKFHPNCNYIATASVDRTIRLWDIQSGKCVRILVGHGSSINDLCFTTDGKCLVSGSQDSTIRIWDIGTANCMKTLRGHEDSVTRLTLTNAISPADTTGAGAFPLVLSASMDKTIRVWNVNDTTQTLAKTIPTNSNTLYLDCTLSNVVMTVCT